jgi:staphylococcal nuclease domain-containing protein 1
VCWHFQVADDILIVLLLPRAITRLADSKQAYYAQEAREFLRKKLIGKHVKVNIDFVRPREGEFEERECATIRYGGQNV